MTNRTVLGLAVVLSVAGFEAFMTLDWGHGIARAVVVLGLLAVMAAAIIVRPVQRGWPRWSLALVSMGVALLLVWHVKEGALSAIRQRHSEMGDIHARAVALLWHGVTPWHFGTVLDSGSFGAFVSSSNLAACRSTAEPPTQSALDAVWSSSTEPGAVFFAQDAQQQPCGHFFAQSGYKYGPAMLAAFAPLVSLWGRSGVYITHLICLFAILAAIAALLCDRRPEAALAAFAVLLGQSLLRRDTLYESDCDLIPTALMLWSLVASERARPFTTGVFVALTLAAKIFPGVFVLPLLVLCSNRVRAIGAFTIVSAAFWGAAISADGMGVWANVFQFNLERGADSTALSF